VIGFNSGYGIKTGIMFNLGNINITGVRKIPGVEFKTGNGYVSDKRNKTG
jgi:hypothetical protein